MKFPYKKFVLAQKSSFYGSSVIRPIIPITLMWAGQEINYFALIDSGADCSIFDAEIAEILGIDLESGDLMQFSGIQEGESSKAYLHDIFISLGGHKYKTTAAFSHEISKSGSGILGQKGFFELFKVGFDYKTEEVEVRERK